MPINKNTPYLLGWIAGLLEGEGSFNVRSKHNPNIQLVMTDKDIVIRAAKIMGAHKVIEQRNKTKANKAIFRTILYGEKAIELMKMIYDLMGERRQIQIDKCIQCFESKERRVYPERKPYSRGAKIVWKGGEYLGG